VSDSAPSAEKSARLADFGGTLGAVFAALCCAGTPFIVSGLAAVGLSFLRRDAVLWPLMIASLIAALWGFWRSRRDQRSWGPFLLALVSSATLSAGVIVIHGFPAMQMIWSAVVGLLLAVVWNRRSR
jgi:mercuric ion transport protein